MQNNYMDGIRPYTLTILVSSLVKSKNYYHHDLGMSIILETEGRIVLGSSDFTPILELIEQPDFPLIRQQAGLYHFAILLPNRKELGRFLHHLIKRQIPVSGGADHGVSEAFYLSDPDQNGIEVYCDKSADVWYNEFKEMNMITAQLDYQGIFYEAEQEEPYLTLPKGSILGHMHLKVRDLEKSRNFYEKMLGFNVMVDQYPGALFLSSNQYHHHLGLNTWSGKNIAKRKSASLGLDSFTLVYPNCESLQAVLDRLKNNQLNVSETADGYMVLDPDFISIKLQLKS